MTSEINDRIAKVKGWRLSEWYEDSGVPGTRSKTPLHTHWYNPAKELEIAGPPDFTSTLSGVAGMLRELHGWMWYWIRLDDARPGSPMHKRIMEYGIGAFVCRRGLQVDFFLSPLERPGDCVGEAYMSVFGKEAVNAM